MHREEAIGTDRVPSQIERENASRPVDMRSGRIERYWVTLPRAVPSDGSLVQEPPLAYMPAHDHLMARCMKGFWVSTDGPLYSTQH